MGDRQKRASSVAELVEAHRAEVEGPAWNRLQVEVGAVAAPRRRPGPASHTRSPTL